MYAGLASGLIKRNPPNRRRDGQNQQTYQQNQGQWAWVSNNDPRVQQQVPVVPYWAPQQPNDEPLPPFQENNQANQVCQPAQQLQNTQEAPQLRSSMESGSGSQMGREVYLSWGGESGQTPEMSQFYAQYHQQTQGMLSNCRGNKKALLIGINYTGTESELRGCVSDVQYVREFLCSTYGFSNNPDSLLVLTDDQRDPSFLPTRQNIINAMHWLVRDIHAGDSLFFQFSGHGTRVEDLDGDEDDGYDEAICPLDYKTAGVIIDDEINDILVRRLVPNVRLTAISDSCHSGSVFDLPYTYYSDGRLKIGNGANKQAAKSFAVGLFNIATKNYTSSLENIFKGISFLTSKKKTNNPDQMALYKGNSFSDVILISGCKDTQTSADTVISGRNTGALTHAFVDVLRRNPTLRYSELLLGIRGVLSGSYSQKPQLSTGHLIDIVNDVFFL